ncbi:MAG: precorrin-2 C(20)-methyltransferase [Lachnospiraceae bacterium]|nr:precorrin-2 C(20)-methyltransferase [Lachnospiraceae bacterium]
MNRRGIIYGVGVGPGDPELMTVKAIRLIQENDVIAVAGKDPKEAVAYRIAAAMVPEIGHKELVSVHMPMVKDRELIALEHEKGARLLESYLDQGRNVVYITLGDPTIYCTFSYLQEIMEKDGYQVELVSGIPSFCASAARLSMPLVKWDEKLHVLPAVHETDMELKEDGTYVLMKSASHMKQVKELLQKNNRSVSMVENCCMDNEKIYRNIEEIPDDAGYFSLIIAKEA